MWKRILAACLLTCFQMCAQQQTGAPAGVPVPPVSAAPPASGSAGSAAETLHFRIRVLDGRTGLPIRNAHVKLWYDEPTGPGYVLATDAHGMANMPAPVGEPVRVLTTITDYTDCRRPMRGDPPKGYSMGDIAHAGTAGDNTCGQIAIRPAPGELVLFARPQRWYEGLNRGTGN